MSTTWHVRMYVLLYLYPNMISAFKYYIYIICKTFEYTCTVLHMYCIGTCTVFEYLYVLYSNVCDIRTCTVFEYLYVLYSNAYSNTCVVPVFEYLCVLCHSNMYLFECVHTCATTINNMCSSCGNSFMLNDVREYSSYKYSSR